MTEVEAVIDRIAPFGATNSAIAQCARDVARMVEV